MKTGSYKDLMREAQTWSLAQGNQCACGRGTLRVEGDFQAPRTVVTQGGVQYGLMEVVCTQSPSLDHTYLAVGYFDLRESPSTSQWPH